MLVSILSQLTDSIAPMRTMTFGVKVVIYLDRSRLIIFTNYYQTANVSFDLKLNTNRTCSVTEWKPEVQ